MNPQVVVDTTERVEMGAPASEDLPNQIANAVETALRRVLSDPEVRRQFWRAGYDEMSEHATGDATKWVGRRLISAIGGALLAAGIWIGFRFGGWGK